MSRAIFAILALVPAVALAQIFGFAVNSDDQADADQLLRVNLSTGAVTFVGPLPVAMEDVEGHGVGASGVPRLISSTPLRALRPCHCVASMFFIKHLYLGLRGLAEHRISRSARSRCLHRRPRAAPGEAA